MPPRLLRSRGASSVFAPMTWNLTHTSHPTHKLKNTHFLLSTWFLSLSLSLSLAGCRSASSCASLSLTRVWESTGVRPPGSAKARGAAKWLSTQTPIILTSAFTIVLPLLPMVLRRPKRVARVVALDWWGEASPRVCVCLLLRRQSLVGGRFGLRDSIVVVVGITPHRMCQAPQLAADLKEKHISCILGLCVWLARDIYIYIYQNSELIFSSLVPSVWVYARWRGARRCARGAEILIRDARQ